MFERKIINDPVFGFINIPKGLLYDVVRHPLLQRLNRIKQLGLSSVVYPGAQHTRFQHSLGAFYLMSEAIQQLATKGNFIFDSEAEAVEAAILMHDIGHGPFSHVLENTIVQGVSHEDISLMLMERINKEMNGQLTLAIQIFKDEYPKRFLHQLVSGQLDMDRLDYLRRDSFYTGVTEGNIGSARIIKMLDVKDAPTRKSKRKDRHGTSPCSRLGISPLRSERSKERASWPDSRSKPTTNKPTRNPSWNAKTWISSY